MSPLRAEVEGIPGVEVIRPDMNTDHRGFLLEIFREDALGVPFVQGNHSHSRAGVLRGLHYHARQSDAWYVVSGTARVGLADLRVVTDRPVVTTVDLSPEEPAALYIPPGVAHGVAALTDLDLVYWVTHYYDATDEHGVAWNDPILAVPWAVEDPILSERDAATPTLDWDAVAAALA
jgi:dTDP-4-dehydrorhamnose 3,5-epimerase